MFGYLEYFLILFDVTVLFILACFFIDVFHCDMNIVGSLYGGKYQGSECRKANALTVSSGILLEKEEITSCCCCCKHSHKWMNDRCWLDRCIMGNGWLVG